MQMLDANEFMDSLDENPEVLAAYDKRRPLYQLCEQLTYARRRAGMTQAQVAKAMGTSKSVVSRIEAPDFKHPPTFLSLMRFAEAVGHDLSIVLTPKGEATLPERQIAKAPLVTRNKAGKSAFVTMPIDTKPPGETYVIVETKKSEAGLIRSADMTAFRVGITQSPVKKVLGVVKASQTNALNTVRQTVKKAAETETFKGVRHPLKKVRQKPGLKPFKAT